MYRFYAPNFADVGRIDLPSDEAQHLGRVLRLRVGDEVAIFDGAGREALARVVSVMPRGVSVEVVQAREAVPESRVSVTLAQALLKSDKMDRVIRDAVMLGVAAIRPVVTRRTDVPMKAVSGGVRQGRWDRTVMSSVKQCGRAVVPRVYAAQEFADVLRTTQGKARLMFVEPGGGGIVLESAGLERDPPSEAVVFVGPEGGWDPQEISAAAASGVTLLSFGRRVLRADAAGAAVLSVLRYIWRDL